MVGLISLKPEEHPFLKYPTHSRSKLVGAGLPAMAVEQTQVVCCHRECFRLESFVVRDGLFAGKPAPTGICGVRTQGDDAKPCSVFVVALHWPALGFSMLANEELGALCHLAL